MIENDVKGPDFAAPSGVVTFLFSDVEGSTALWAADESAMSASLQLHDALVRGGIESRSGYVFTTAGDAFCAAFQRASDAIAAAREIVAELDAADWPGPVLRIRVGLHLGEAEERGGDYFGPVVNVAARVAAVGHGGQVLVTDSIRLTAEVTGVDLGEHALKDVPGLVKIFQLGNGEFAPLRSVGGGVRSNLPVTATRLIGRSDEVRTARRLLAEHRLVTLLGVGGTGKTRLAVEIAAQELAHWPDGVWFVDLTQVGSDDDVTSTVAEILRLELQAGDQVAQIARFVAGQSMLIVLDNCEHLIDACARFVGSVLAAGGSSKFLATSREWLDIEFEHIVRVGSLDTSVGGDAFRLFAERARASDPDFEPEAEAVISELCRRLDGMPLAIELAAARVAVLPPEKLLEGLSDRFRMLSGGRRRQRGRTLEATIDWSYDLLQADEQQFFRQLGVFLGSFDTEAIAAITDTSVGEAIDLIEVLFVRSLVAASAAHHGRFELLETIKAYAEDRLVDNGEASETRERLYRYYAPTTAPQLVFFSSSLRAAAAFADDHGTLGSIADWLEDAGRWTELATFLLRNHRGDLRDPTRAGARLARCRANIDDPVLDPELAECQLELALAASDWETFMRVGAEQMAHADPHHAGVAHLLVAIPTGAVDVNKALALVDRFVELPSRLDAKTKQIWEASVRCHSWGIHGDSDRAKAYGASALEVMRRTGFEHWLRVGVLHAVGTACFLDQNQDELDSAVEDMIAALGPSDDPLVRSMADFLIALVATGHPDDPDRARELSNYLRRYSGGHVAQGESDAIVILAAKAAAAGDTELVAKLVRAPITPRAPGGYMVLHRLAEQVGVGAEVRELRSVRAVTNGGRLDLDAPRRILLAELEGREW